MENRHSLNIAECCGSCKFCIGIADTLTKGQNNKFCSSDGYKATVVTHSGDCIDYVMKDFYKNLDPIIGEKGFVKPARYFKWLHTQLHFESSIPKEMLTFHPFSVWLHDEDSIEWRKLHPTVKAEFSLSYLTHASKKVSPKIK